MADIVVVLLGNSAPQMQRPVTNTQGEVVGSQSVAAEHMQQSVTRVEMQPDFADEEFVKATLSTDNDRTLANIATLLGEPLNR